MDVTSISDADALQEAGAPQQSCDNGATMRGSVNNPVTGLIRGPNIIKQGGQTCHYQDCEFAGSLTINNATAYLKNCGIAGQLTMNSGKLYTLPLNSQNPTNAQSVNVGGNIQIGSKDNLPNSFSIGPGTNGHNLTIQNLPSGGLGYVCWSTFVGGVNVNNNASSIQIGNNTQETNCPGNFISGGLECKGNTPNRKGVATPSSPALAPRVSARAFNHTGGSGAGRDKEAPVPLKGRSGSQVRSAFFNCYSHPALCNPSSR